MSPSQEKSTPDFHTSRSLSVQVVEVELKEDRATVEFQMIYGYDSCTTFVEHVDVEPQDRKVDRIMTTARANLRGKLLRAADLLGNEWAGWT